MIWGRKDRISHTLWVIYDESLVSDKRAAVKCGFSVTNYDGGRASTIESRFNSTSTVFKCHINEMILYLKKKIINLTWWLDG